MNTTNLSTLKIHKLSQAQYERELAAGTLDENALYLTPHEEVDTSNYATKEYVTDSINAIEIPAAEPELPTVTTDDNGKVLGVTEGAWAAVETVQADWDETDTTSPAYIKNKPVISGDGSTSVQANWNQTDETQPDYIKNKPFGEENEIVEILPSTTYSNFSLDSTYGMYARSTPPTYTLTIGKTYYILWDGIAYECVSQDASALVSGAVILGNASSLGLDGNNEPFIIASIAGTGTQYFSLTDTEAGNSHTVSITTDGVVVKKIESKYLSQPDWNENDDSSAAYINNKPFGIIPLGTIVVEETQVYCTQPFNDYLYMAFIDEPDIGAYTYNVEFDSVTYQCVGEVSDSGRVDLGYVSEDDSFAFQILRNFSGYHGILTTQQGEHTFKITLAEDAIKKLDSQYLPDDISGLPEVTTDDVGKFLRVSSDGVWAVESIPNAEEATF